MRSLRRRTALPFRSGGIVLLTLPVLASLASAQAAEPRRPNIVFIFSDDHAYQAISAYGDPRKLNETPNIDRIAREGMRFDRCLVTNSICGPSRATVLTGKYSHVNGFYNNTNSRFDGSQMTFPKLLQAAGYQTAIVGKWHLVTDPTGFDYWHILPGQGVYYNPPMIDNGKRVKHEGYVTDIITDLSLDWLKKRDKTKPFLLMCQHKAPHREWEPALRHLGHDSDRNYPEPRDPLRRLRRPRQGRARAGHDDRQDDERDTTSSSSRRRRPDARAAQSLGRLLRAAERGIPEGRILKGEDLVRWKYNRYMHDYLGCIKAVDESVGRVLDYLDDEGWPRTRSSSTRPTRASTSASTAGSTSAGSSRSRCARRCWSAGRAW